MDKPLISLFGDVILHGCGYGYCAYCEYDPYPADCRRTIEQTGKREIKEIRR